MNTTMHTHAPARHMPRTGTAETRQLYAEAERLLDDAELRQRRAKAERAQRAAAEADEYFTEGRQHRRAGHINPHD